MSAKCECPECGNIHRLNGVAGPEKPGRLAAADELLREVSEIVVKGEDGMTETFCASCYQCDGHAPGCKLKKHLEGMK